MRRAFTLALAAGLFAAIGACGGPREVEVGVSAGSARLGVGEILRVDLGAVNASIGDSWHLVGAPDPAVLSEPDWHYAAECDQPGCGGRLTWTFKAVGPGATTVVFQYCYRSAPEHCQAEPDRGPRDPVALAVTVG